jgi:hypothetical protein
MKKQAGQAVAQREPLSPRRSCLWFRKGLRWVLAEHRSVVQIHASNLTLTFLCRLHDNPALVSQNSSFDKHFVRHHKSQQQTAARRPVWRPTHVQHHQVALMLLLQTVSVD